MIAEPQYSKGILDTNILILRRWIDSTELPDELAITTVTLAELSAGPHQVELSPERDEHEAAAERARRTDILQRVEHEFDPIPFGVEAARVYGRLCAAVIGRGKKSRSRIADLMIAAIAAAEELPLFTTNPNDFLGMHTLVTVVPVRRPLARRPSRMR